MTCRPQGSYSLNPSILKQSDPQLARIAASQTPVAFHSDESDDEVAPSHMGLPQSPDCVLALFDPDPEIKNQPRRSQQQWLRYSRVADGARNAALKLGTWLATQAGRYHGLELSRVTTAEALKCFTGGTLDRQMKECLVHMATEAIENLTREISTGRFEALKTASQAAKAEQAQELEQWEQLPFQFSMNVALGPDDRRHIFVKYSQSGGDLSLLSMVSCGWRAEVCTMRREWIARGLGKSESDPWNLQPALAMEWKRLEWTNGKGQSVKHTWDLAGVCIRRWGAKLFKEVLRKHAARLNIHFGDGVTGQLCWPAAG